ncbi:MAG: histidine phosphatase family protein [Butyrivibrio sp.]|nr:histidine phosphatase family protein [Butyrivibrio sp.]
MAHKKVFLIRHGVTPGNAEKRYVGRRTDESLSPEGVAAATKAKKNTSELNADRTLRVCASPMKRALQTAEILFEGKAVHIVEDLAEMDFGLFEGKNHADLDGNSEYQAWLDAGGQIDIPGSEGMMPFQDRSYRGFLTALGEKDIAQTIAIVCHGGTVMALMSRFFGGNYYDYMIDNLGGFSIDLEYDHKGIHDLTYHSFGGGDNP